MLRQLLAAAHATRSPAIGVVAGSGVVARAARQAGADFLVALSAGAYRTLGQPSLAAQMPFGDTNALTDRLLNEHLLPHAAGAPVLAGFVGQPGDPGLAEQLRGWRDRGVTALTVYPSVGLIDGQFRAALEADGLGLATEIAALRWARSQGFETFPYVFTAADAGAWAASGVDGLVLVMGMTRGVDDLRERRERLEQAFVTLNAMHAAVKAVAPELPCIAYGGPVTTPEDLELLFRLTNLEAFAGGSVFERLPLRDVTGTMVRRFKSVAAAAATASSGSGASARADSHDGGTGAGASSVNGLGRMIGRSPAMIELFRLIQRIAPYDVSVVVEGETGVGKELVAGQIHRLSTRANQPFVTLNCGALPETLLESELFGHEKGAFTGADRRRAGKFELAHGGTLFLDEVASLSPHGQVALLRALQQREITRIGGDAVIPVDVRVVAASNLPLAAQVAQGRFRVDLFHRLNQFTLAVPPLRERGDDLQRIAEDCLQRLATELDKRLIGLSPRFLERLSVHAWPGNVRELQHVILQAVLREDGPVLEGAFFQPEPVIGGGMIGAGGGAGGRGGGGGEFAAGTGAAGSLAGTLGMGGLGGLGGGGFAAAPGLTPGTAARDSRWRQAVERAYREARGNKTRTAAALGVTRRTLYAWLRECGLG